MRLARRFAFLLVVVTSGLASADGERTPMVGVAGFAAETNRSGDDNVALGGLALDVASWHGRFGLAAEASARWGLDDDSRAYVLGASARVLLVDGLVASPVEPRDVEAGLELHAIVERAWWRGNRPDADPMGYGLGLALRFRGGGDQDGSTLLAESRFFFRVMSSRWNQVDTIARTSTMDPSTPSSPRSLTVLIGIGASFGSGTPDYTRRFRPKPFEPTLL